MSTVSDATAIENPIPSEFLYYERINRPRTKRLRSLAKRITKFDPYLDDETVATFAESYYQADPVAEAFVDDVYMTRGAVEGRKLLDQALEHGIDSVQDAPESMIRLFKEFETEPEWLDWAEVEKGAKVFRRWGTDLFTFATTSTLQTYTEASIAKPLALTGGYTGERAHQRQLETVRFWIDVSNPGGLESSGRGRATAMRVRVMHVFIRRRLLKHEEWDLAAWGVPISIGDALMTLMGGSVAPGLGLFSLGHITTPSEIRATMHFWRYVGHLMGVQPPWYPETVRDGVRLLNVFMLKAARQAGDDGRELVESYLPAFKPNPEDPLRKRVRDGYNFRVQVGFSRYLYASFGAKYGLYSMPNAWPWVAIPVMRLPLMLGLELSRQVVPGLDTAADKVQSYRREQWFKNEMGEKAAVFKPVEEFRR